MLNWTTQFNIFCFLDSCQYQLPPHRYDCLLAAGASRIYEQGELSSLNPLLTCGEWTFGHLSYELKNAIHGVTGTKPDPIAFPEWSFFHPEILLLIKGDELTICASDPARVYQELTAIKDHQVAAPAIAIKQRLSKGEYLDKIHALQKHIQRGDCYEINFCQEFYAENAVVDPGDLFLRLTELSPNPFSALYAKDDRYLICASPERFLFKEGNCILSQPMKGTIKRDRYNVEADMTLKETLFRSEKDRSENVMIVDLVRNDLSRVCTRASVKVDELFGVYAFPQVYQMVSTISGELKAEATFSDILKASFPMGSMTGAPKHRVMELIDQYEVSTRGIFSGSVGYIDPHGNFDFNVVIRSIMYNAANQYLSYQVGSGITFYSDPEMEWDECLLKGMAIKKVLTGS